MASIILSFVGSQDPFAKTDTEGSIITLVKHLLQQSEIKQVILLHTTGTTQNAIDTKEWLESDPVNLAAGLVTVVAVSDLLSGDPVNLLLAVEAARMGLETAIRNLTLQDVLEFNASSGTPVMKSAWSILQAAGYAPRSHVWQVRNPMEKLVDQPRVFKTDVDRLRKEFDLKIIKQQVQDYNYNGALITLGSSGLETKTIAAMLRYGYYRFTLNFDQAAFSISKQMDAEWTEEIDALRKKDSRSLLREAYLNALIRLKNRQYADFLICVFRLQEKVLSFLVSEKLGLQISEQSQERSWREIQRFEGGRLYQHLKQSKIQGGRVLRVDGMINRFVLIAILEYDSRSTAILQLIKELNDYCDRRNESVHEFVGVSKIEDEARLLTVLREMIGKIVGIPEENPFDRLNQQIFRLLDRAC